MVVILFYFFASILFCIGALLRRHTSPYSRVGGSKYERRRLRRTIAEIIMAVALLALALAIISQTIAHFQQ